MITASRTNTVVSIAFAAAMFAVLGRGVASAEMVAGSGNDLPPCPTTNDKTINQACEIARRGKLLYMQQHLPEAIASLQEALKLYPKQANTAFILGESYFETGQFDLALPALTNGINLYNELNTPQAIAYTTRGRTYLALEQAGKDTAGKNYLALAKADFMETVKIDPTFHEAYDELGRIELKESHFKAAVKLFTQAVDILAQLGEPKSAVYRDRGFAEFKLKHFWNALEDFNVSLVLDPDQPDVYFGRGQVHMALDNYMAAANDFADCMKHGRQDAQIYGLHALAMFSELEAKALAGKNNANNVVRIVALANKDLDQAEALHPGYEVMQAIRDLREQLDVLVIVPNGVPNVEAIPTPAARSGNPSQTAPDDAFGLG